MAFIYSIFKLRTSVYVTVKRVTQDGLILTDYEIFKAQLQQ